MLAPRTGDTGHHLASGLVGKLDIVPKSSPQLRQAPDFIKNTISPLLEQADLDPAHDTHAEEPPQRFTLSGGAVDGIIFMVRRGCGPCPALPLRCTHAHHPRRLRAASPWYQARLT